MVNRWTGGFDAALQVAPSGADRLLAAVHRKGDPLEGVAGGGPHLLHSVAFDLPLPGAQLERDLRGHLQVQVSTPRIEIAAAPDRVRAAFEIYAWFRPAPGSDPAPAFVHGTLGITATVQVVECGGSVLAELRVSTADLEARFDPAPGSGLAEADARLVEELAREFLRKGLRPIQLRVSGFGSGELRVARLGLRALGSGASAALVALLGFSSAGQANAGVSDVFLQAGEHAGLALGREFLVAMLFELAQAPLSGISVSGSRYGVSFDAAPDPASFAVELLPGILRVSVDGTGSLSPGGSFGFRLTQDLTLHVAGGALRIALADQPELDITQGNALLKLVLNLFKGRILDELEVAASGLVLQASAELDRVVGQSLQDLLAELQIPGVRLALARASIDPDGVIAAGRVDLGPTTPVLASFAKRVHHAQGTTIASVGTEFSAFESWIPGGTIQSYRWLEVRADGGVARSVQEDHRFVVSILPEVVALPQVFGWPPYTWCLEVRGTQFVDDRDPVPATGVSCGLSVVVPGVDLPRAGGRLTVHVPDGQGGVLADLDPWGRYRPHAFAEDEEQRGVLLVHRVDGDPRAAIDALSGVLHGARREASVFPALVLDDVERAYRCGAPARALAAIALTDDPEGEWRRRFRLERPGATALLGPGGRALWRHAGPLRSEELEKVLDGLALERARHPRYTHVRIAVPHGAFAPEIFFPCGPQEAFIAMSKLRGRAVDVLFWTSWSRASLEELRRRAAAGAPADDREVLFVNDGEEPALAARTLRELGLDGHLATDEDRSISRAYGITCWPTLVRVDAAGRVAGVRLGLEHRG